MPRLMPKTSLQINAPYKDVGTYSVTLQGSGGYGVAGTQITPGGVIIREGQVYNKALHLRTQAWYEKQERVGYAQTSSMLTEWKKQEELNFLNEVSCVPLQRFSLSPRNNKE